MIRTIFLSPDEARLHAGWRLAIQTLLLLVILVALSIPTGLLFNVLPAQTPYAVFLGLDIIVELLAFSISIFLARRFLDRRTFVSLGFKLDRHVVPDLLAGIAITMIMMASIYLAMQAFGWIRFDTFGWNVDPFPVLLGQLLLYLVVYAIVGFQEELLSRGYHLQTLASGTNLFWGVLFSSAVFGLLHLGNPDATWASAAGIFFAGLFLALGFVRTGQLWLSIGLHLGWNFFEGVVFGFPVSGFDSYHLLRIDVAGPVLWTGGAFGPEAGLIVLPAIALGALLLIAYTRFRNRPATFGKPNSV